MRKLVKEKLHENNIGEWELTEITAAGTVTRNNKSITGEDIVYHDEDVNEQNFTEKSSFEDVSDTNALEARRKALKKQGHYIENSKVSKGFTARKDNKRIVVRIK